MNFENDPLFMRIARNSCAAVASQDGRYRRDDAAAEVIRQLSDADLDAGQRAITQTRLGYALLDRYEERLNPRLRKAGFYNPNFVLKLGRGDRVTMERATAADLNDWILLSSRNAENVRAAEIERQEYGVSRIEAFRLRPDIPYLDEIERSVFGYSDDGDPDPLF